MTPSLKKEEPNFVNLVNSSQNYYFDNNCCVLFTQPFNDVNFYILKEFHFGPCCKDYMPALRRIWDTFSPNFFTKKVKNANEIEITFSPNIVNPLTTCKCFYPTSQRKKNYTTDYHIFSFFFKGFTIISKKKVVQFFVQFSLSCFFLGWVGKTILYFMQNHCLSKPIKYILH